MPLIIIILSLNAFTELLTFHLNIICENYYIWTVLIFFIRETYLKLIVKCFMCLLVGDFFLSCILIYAYYLKKNGKLSWATPI